MKETLRAIYKYVNTLAEWICYALIAVLVVLTSVQVFLRYVLRSPLSWSQEVSILILVWFSMVVVALGVHHNTHMAIRVVWQRLGPRAQYVVNVAVELLTLALAVNIVINAQPLIAVVSHQRLPASGLPRTWMYYSLWLGGGLMAFNAIGNILLDNFPAGKPDIESVDM